MSGNLALDSNLTLVLAVGRTGIHLMGRHKRLRQYSEVDFNLLLGFVAGADPLVTTPNALTEISNIATFGIIDPARAQIISSVRGLIDAFYEIYKPSKELAHHPAFSRLGLADCAWLATLDARTRFLTVDLELYLAASKQGHDAINFNHIKEQLGRA